MKKLIGLNKSDSDKTEDDKSDNNENTDKKEEK